MNAKILEAIYEQNKLGKDAALCFLIENKGSTPGEDNSVMAIFSDGSILGTVGGGSIEKDIIRRTLEGMKDGNSFEFDYNLSKNGELKMSCGGNCRGFVKYFKSSNRLLIFGAGHVSQKLSRVASKTSFEVTVIDDRKEFKDSPDFIDIKEFIAEDFYSAVEKINFDEKKTYIVLCNRGHAYDEKALEVIKDKDFAYLGMIGSKAASLFKELKEEGISEQFLNKIYTPIGLDIDNGSVEEIAISIMAEILMVKNNKDASIQRLTAKWDKSYHIYFHLNIWNSFKIPLTQSIEKFHIY